MITAPSAARLLIVDDHPLFRDALRNHLSLQDDMAVVGEAEGISDALRLAKELCIDLAIIDLSLADGNGMELVQEFHRVDQSIRALIVSMHDESRYAQRALRSGASGYVNKAESPAEIVSAIRKVLDGKVHLSSAMTQQVICKTFNVASSDEMSLDQLTNRELEILELLGQGLSTRIIADRLFLSVNTVDSYRERIKRKLGLRNSAELCRTAVEWVLQDA